MDVTNLHGASEDYFSPARGAANLRLKPYNVAVGTPSRTLRVEPKRQSSGTTFST
ncbi:hypothetical protein J6590_088092 [Homalodisca vitripennis]|nr:hypothetical protein J6590_088092 [Homalodisca vitripennis]